MLFSNPSLHPSGRVYQPDGARVNRDCRLRVSDLFGLVFIEPSVFVCGVWLASMLT
jgi:hypothetical protein